MTEKHNLPRLQNRDRLTILEYRLLIRDKRRNPGGGNKYNAKKVRFGEYVFDSIWEFEVYRDHVLLQRARKISHLNVHPKYELYVGKQKVATYIADLSYTDNVTGLTVVVDAKSPATMTKVSRLKHKMFRAQYRHELKIVMKPKGWVADGYKG